MARYETTTTYTSGTRQIEAGQLHNSMKAVREFADEIWSEDPTAVVTVQDFEKDRVEHLRHTPPTAEHQHRVTMKLTFRDLRRARRIAHAMYDVAKRIFEGDAGVINNVFIDGGCAYVFGTSPVPAVTTSRLAKVKAPTVKITVY